MSSAHWSRIADHVGIAANAVADAMGDCTLVLLGADAAPPENLHPSVRLVRPGFLEAEDVGPWIAASDVYLAAYIDGVSARRTSFLAGLQQGVAVVGTKGRSTDPEFLDCPGIRLTAVDDAIGFGVAAVAVAADPQSRATMASYTKQMFDERYSFALVASRWLGQIGRARAGLEPARNDRTASGPARGCGGILVRTRARRARRRLL
jgi:glycosyltransferase involved in cell wall biosynthesis